MNRSLMMVLTGIGLAVVAAAGFGSLPACSSSKSSSSTAVDSGSGGRDSGVVATDGGDFSSGPFVGPDVPLPAGVKLQPDVVLVHGGASVVKSVSSDYGTWTIDKSADGVAGLSAGKILLIAGVDCARATAIKDNGNGTLDVTIAPVAFVDVIEEGSFSWKSTDIDWTHAVIGQVPYAIVAAAEATDGGVDGAVADAASDASESDGGAGDAEASDAEAGDAGDAGDAQADAGDAGDAGCSGDGGAGCAIRIGHMLRPRITSRKITVGGWTVQLTATAPSSGVKISVNAVWTAPTGFKGLNPFPGPAQTLGKISTTVNATVAVTNLWSTSGSMNISGGSISTASLTSDIAGSVDMSADMTATAGSQFPKAALLKLPLAIEYPYFLGPIPLYVSVSMALSIQPSLATTGSQLSITGHIDSSGNAGMTFGNGTISPGSVPSLTTPPNPLLASPPTPEIGAMALVFAVEAPRVGVGVGLTAFGLGAKAGVFVDWVNAYGITVAPVTSLVPCLESEFQGSWHAGGEMKLSALGLSKSSSGQITLGSTPEKVWYTPDVSSCQP